MDEMFHIVLHFVVPVIAAPLFGAGWRRAYLMMLGAFVIDIDHLLADPIYDPGRCSVGFHSLHEPVLLPLYTMMLVPTALRPLGVGIFIHLGLDSLDCYWQSGVWAV